ncbi:MAG: SAM-dependent methyltransferase [Bacteroidia bacterium]|nr:MAG: SAM-dependent methyltransferase [Bacteroidia bacterium]
MTQTHKTINNREGHWILARMGKKVLRPGGKELTLQMIDKLSISKEDKVVEFAPGLGFTANITLKKEPNSYTGVEINEEAARILRKKINGSNQKIVVGNAEASGLEDNSYTKVYNEAMLTMQSGSKKSAIMREAHRILRPGGLYGIHEIALRPDDISDALKTEIKQQLAGAIKVNARPLTAPEWKELLEKEGFEVIETLHNPFHLLKSGRMIQDEGFMRSLKIFFNILTHPQARKRILQMKKVFRKYEKQMSAISIIARKK